MKEWLAALTYAWKGGVCEPVMSGLDLSSTLQVTLRGGKPDHRRGSKGVEKTGLDGSRPRLSQSLVMLNSLNG